MSVAPVRVGFIGCGKQASASWYPNFATIPELDLYACCDLEVELAERNARAVQKGESGSPTLRDACQAMVVCEAICDSIERKAPVDVELS